MKWIVNKREMKNESDGTNVECVAEESEFAHLIQGGRTDHIHVVLMLAKEFSVEVGKDYYIGLVIDEAFEPYGLQMKMCCHTKRGQKAYFDVQHSNEPIYELPLIY